MKRSWGWIKWHFQPFQQASTVSGFSHCGRHSQTVFHFVTNWKLLIGIRQRDVWEKDTKKAFTTNTLREGGGQQTFNLGTLSYGFGDSWGRGVKSFVAASKMLSYQRIRRNISPDTAPPLMTADWSTLDKHVSSHQVKSGETQYVWMKQLSFQHPCPGKKAI